MMLVMLTTDLVSFLKEGLAIMVATRNEKFLARGTRAYAIFTHEDKQHITFYINELSSAPMISNMLSNQEVSLSIARSTDYRAIQIKGKYVSHRSIDERDKLLIERHTVMFADNVGRAGGDRERYLVAFPTFPALAITMKVETVYNQTPGSASSEAIV